MAIEGFDAALPIETAGFVPQVGITEAPAAEPTLDAALAQAQRIAREDMAAPDLWVEDPAGPYRPHAGASHANPVAGMVPSADDPLILHKLTIDDMTRASSTGRYGDSTEDYVWNEMSSGDWDWAYAGLKSAVQNDIKFIMQTSPSFTDAQQRVHQYLVDHGLTNAIQVYNSETYGADGAILVTGQRLPLPPLLNFDLMGGSASWLGNDGGSVNTTQPLPTDPIPDNNPDGPDVGVEILDPINTAEIYMAADILKSQIEVLDTKFHNLSDIALIPMKNGYVATGAEVKAWWNSLDFRVTDRRFDIGAGAVLNGISNMNYEALLGWDRSDANGLIFIILHELIHNSPEGTSYNALEFFFHTLFDGIDRDYDKDDVWFDSNEEYANWGARSIMTALGIPIPAPMPAFGYDDTTPATMPTTPPPPPPPPPPSGGGGTGGGGHVNYQ
jgi:hypothetical protein